MTRTTLVLVPTFLAGLTVGALGIQALDAQPQGIKRTLLMKKELAGIAGREVYMGTAELASGAAAGRHLHPGHEIGYVLEGSGVLEIEGQSPIPFKAGDHYHIEAMKPHDARNTGSSPAKVVAIYLIEKGKPLATPAR